MRKKRACTRKAGRILRSAEERRALIEQYRASGLGKMAFAREHGIHPTTFCNWFADRDGDTAGFRKLTLPLNRGPALEVSVPGGITIRVGVLADDMEKLGMFVRAVAGISTEGAQTC